MFPFVTTADGRLVGPDGVTIEGETNEAGSFAKLLAFDQLFMATGAAIVAELVLLPMLLAATTFFLMSSK